jgi:hypothetical protein
MMKKIFTIKRSVQREGMTKHRAGIPLSELRIVVYVMVILCGLFPYIAVALDTDIEGLNVMGYINQGIRYSTHSGKADNKDEFNSFLFEGLLETRYQPNPGFVMFSSLKLNADWAYEIYSGNQEWKDKGFNESRDDLFIYNEFRDFVGELHFSWKPNEQLYFRIGKQIVQWGETDGFLLMNQINPVDQRRGMGNVQFESLLIPIWLFRAEYNPAIESTWLSSLNIQFIFDPNADFAKNETIEAGNDMAGVWAPFVEAVPGMVLLGSYRDTVKQPDDWDPQGEAFGLRISGMVSDARVSLNGYYGRSHDLVRSGMTGADMTVFANDPQWLVVHPHYDAKYPYFRFAGATVAMDIDSLSISSLGGVSPILRFEGLYAFNSTFSTNNDNMQQYLIEQGDKYWESDECRWMVGFDWKIKVNAINPKAYIFISPQVYEQYLIDYPKIGYAGLESTGRQYQDTWTTSLLVNTTYFHNKLMPSFFWLRNWRNESEFFKPEVSYEYDNHWKYTLGALFFRGSKTAEGLEVFKNKDNIYATISYRF